MFWFFGVVVGVVDIVVGVFVFLCWFLLCVSLVFMNLWIFLEKHIGNRKA